MREHYALGFRELQIDRVATFDQIMFGAVADRIGWYKIRRIDQTFDWAFGSVVRGHLAHLLRRTREGDLLHRHNMQNVLARRNPLSKVFTVFDIAAHHGAFAINRRESDHSLFNGCPLITDTPLNRCGRGPASARNNQ